MALDAIFNGPGSEAAEYRPANGDPVKPGVRVIRSRPDQAIGFGQGQVIADTNTIDVRMSDVPEPAVDDIFALGERLFRVNADPLSDVEELTWQTSCEPVEP
ncbi:hypothetical protein GGQ80_002084 [Sphingomonas jinjuensis]|uniref:Uncharacterized protein n=2 Tax=Sphingomonas jinjuensis TaxID=535907 RepID=A0A840FEL6_9SPHN|nr:hypothetical protein [Sphingomonas jinjuensis]MBB4154174.1 hypothetical protein [Sphingomonas jinjuensis]